MSVLIGLVESSVSRHLKFPINDFREWKNKSNFAVIEEITIRSFNVLLIV